MRTRFILLTIATAVATAGLLAVTPATAQAPEYRAPRAPDGRPDLNGIWQALNTAHWDIEPHAAGPSMAGSPTPPRPPRGRSWLANRPLSRRPRTGRSR